MKTIMLLHTVKSMLNEFEKALRAEVGEAVCIYNVYDEFLAIDPGPQGHGYFTDENKQRLKNHVINGKLMGADIVAATCSTLSDELMSIQNETDVKIITIDGSMIREAARSCDRITVIATADSTIPITCGRLEAMAHDLGKKPNIEVIKVAQAYEDMKRGNMAAHDSLVLERARHVKDCDCIILAQASMAHLKDQIETVTGIRTLASVNFCIYDIKKELSKGLRPYHR